MGSARAARAAPLAALVAGASLVAGAAWVAVTSPAQPVPSQPPRPAGASDAPTIWYSAETAREVVLLVAPLDGSAPPRVAASRASGPSGTVRAWHVGPTGGTVLWAHGDDGARSVLEGVEVETGRTVWQHAVDGHAENGLWSADGRLWAATVHGPEGEPGSYVVLDAGSGAARSVPIVPGAEPLGFTAGGDLVLGERLVDDIGWTSGWRFHRSPMATGGLEPLPFAELRDATLSARPVEISASRLREARRVLLADGQADRMERLQLIDLASGDRRFIGPADASGITTVSFTPDGSRLILELVVRNGEAEPTHSLVALDLEGAGGEIWRGPSVSDRVFSFDGRYIATSSWAGHPAITAINIDTGSAADVPLPDALVSAGPLAIRSNRDQPVLAIAEPTPTPTPPATPAPSAVPGAPQLARSWVEETSDGRRLGHVDVLAPADGAETTVVAALEPLELHGGETITASPVEGGDDWLVHVQAWPGLRLWRWTPGRRAVPITLPDAVAASASTAILHPDGTRIAVAHYSGASGAPVLTIVDPVGDTAHDIVLRPPYTELAGWAGDGRRIVLAHHVCTEGCEGRYASLAWLDPASRQVSPFGPTDRDTRVSPWSAVPNHDRGEIVLTSIEDEADDDIVLDWPDDRPAPNVRYQRWSSGVADLYLELVDDDVSRLVVIRDAAAGGPGRHRVSPEPIGALPPGLTVEEIGPDERWVLARDRADETWLVDLETGAAAPIPRPGEPAGTTWDDDR